MRASTATIAVCTALTIALTPVRARAQASAVVSPVRPLPDSLFAADTIAFTPAARTTLRDAINSAIALSPVTARAAAVSRLARGAERVAGGEYLPYLSVTSSLGHNGAPLLPGQALSTVVGPIGVGGGAAGAGGRGGNADSTTTRASLSSPITLPTPSSALRAPSAYALAPTDNAAQQPGATTAQPWAIPALTFTAGYDLFTGGRRGADVVRARAETKAADAIAVRQHFVVVDSVETAFFQVLRAHELDSLAREQAARAAEDAREAERRHEVGTATTDEVLQFAVDLATARTTVLQAEIDRRSGAYALGRLIGLDGGVLPTDDGSGAVRELMLSDSAIVALATTAAPTLLAARDSAAAAQAANVAAHAEYLPTIRVGTAYTFTRSGVENSATRPGWAVGISTTYPIFNGFVREYDAQRASEASKLARTTARDAHHKILADVKELLGAVALSIRRVTLATQAVVSARENYRVQFSRYHLVLASVLELRSAEQSLSTAEQQLVSARYSYISARAALETLVGREL